jgi:hypothetical protein
MYDIRRVDMGERFDDYFSSVSEMNNEVAPVSIVPLREGDEPIGYKLACAVYRRFHKHAPIPPSMGEGPLEGG